MVYLMELNNATQDPQLDSAGVLLRNHLVQSFRVRLADDAKVARAESLIGAEAAHTGANAREIALRVGAALVVFSSLVRIGDRYQLSVRIDRVGTSPSVAGGSVTHEWQAGGKQQIFAALKDAGDFIRTSAGESTQEVARQDISPDEAASSSWEALDLYRRSETLRRQKQVDAAIAMLERAIQIDPDFALAHVLLGDLLNGVRRQEEAFEHYQRALQAAGKRRLTRWEELLLRGNYALDTGDFHVAEAAFSELRSLYPRLYLPPHYLAAAVRDQGRLEEALQLEREAASRDHELTQPLVSVAGITIRLDRFSGADAELARLRELDRELASEYEGQILFLRGDLPQAQSLFQVVSRSSEARRRSRGFSLLGQFYAEAGEYTRAYAAYLDGISSDLAAGLSANASLKHMALGWLHLRAGDPIGARNHCLEAVRLVRSAELYRRAGTVLARAGFETDAQRLLDDLGPRWPGPLAEAARHHIQGEILLHGGDRAAALRELEAADRLDSPLRLREYLAHAYAASDGERALFLYESLLRLHGAYWQYADCELPGMRASMLLETADLAHQLGHQARAQAAIREYQQIRPSADLNLPETARAKHLAAGAP
jgi:tetratricopeptide (TPR) repeat protein